MTAAPQAPRRRPLCVLKVGGGVLERPRGLRALVGSVQRARLRRPLVVVHGGGGQVSRMAERLGLRSTFRDGRRVTNAEMVEVVEMVLSGLLNKALVAALVRAGVPALGLSGKDLGLVEAVAVPGLGRSGVPRRVEAAPLRDLLALGFTPVLASVASDGRGETLNINADDLAAAVAGALEAESLVLVSAGGGVRRDPDNRRSAVVRRLSALEAEARIALGVLTRGMIPKVRAARRALEQGVGRVGIVAPSSAATLADALERGRGRGTWIFSENRAGAEDPRARARGDEIGGLGAPRREAVGYAGSRRGVRRGGGARATLG